jgi:hypothetical protein
VNRVAVCTIVSASYVPLFSIWLAGVRRFLPFEVVVLDVSPDRVLSRVRCDCEIIPVRSRHALSISEAHHATGWKLQVFNALPARYDGVVFIDVDVMCLSVPVTLCAAAARQSANMAMAVDYFVGYKETLEDEMRLFDRNFRVRFFPDGRQYYFNTGVWWAPRITTNLFEEAFVAWNHYYAATGRLPSIWDQNIFNYVITKSQTAIDELPVTENCLRQYAPSRDKHGHLVVNGQLVNLMHFNGGTVEAKAEGMANLLSSRRQP